MHDVNDDINQTPASHIPLIIGAWVIVAIPLVYGFVQTMKNAVHLFTGG
jgi:hypothetical protein